MNILILFSGIVAILILMKIHYTITKPVFNKMYNMWEEDKHTKEISTVLIIGMIIIGFLMGFLIGSSL